MGDDSWRIVPFGDPFDTDYDYLNILSDHNPTLASLEQHAPGAIPISHNINVANDDPLNDPMIWNFLRESQTNNMKAKSQEAGPSNYFHGDSLNSGRAYPFPPNIFDGLPLSMWPPSPVPFYCTCCQILREIIHTDGAYTTKLEIHGRLGMICHAILESRENARSLIPSHSQYYMFDFCKQHMENVKLFLQQYCDDRKNAGYVMLLDPLSSFYETLCVGLDWEMNFDNDDFFDELSPTNSEGERQADHAEGENDTDRSRKSNLAQQRERAGKLTLKDFVTYFHLPIEEASKRMNLCPTVVKKICRREGMHRWPHRKIKSIDRQIANLIEVLNVGDSEERARAHGEIQRLQQEKKRIYAIADPNR